LSSTSTLLGSLDKDNCAMDFHMIRGNTTFTVLRKKTKNGLDTGLRNQTMLQCFPTIK